MAMDRELAHKLYHSARVAKVSLEARNFAIDHDIDPVLGTYGHYLVLNRDYSRFLEYVIACDEYGQRRIADCVEVVTRTVIFVSRLDALGYTPSIQIPTLDEIE